MDVASAPPASTIIKSVDEPLTSSTTLQADNELTFTLSPNKKYVINGGIFATAATAQPDIKIAFTVGTGTTMDIAYFAQGGSNRTAELLETSGSESDRIAIPTGNGIAIIQTFGSVVTGTSTGTLALQWAQFSSNATATKVKQGSYMTVTEATE